MKSDLTEGKKVLDLAVSKCLTGARLSEKELKQMINITERELMHQYGCDFVMTEKIKTHTKLEQHRQRSQNLYNKKDNYESGYPKSPLTRTKPIVESKKKLLEQLSDSQMVDYISQEISGNRTSAPVISVEPANFQNTTVTNPSDGLLEKRLTQYLGMLRGMQLWYHGAHHATRGTGFVSDHGSLFGDFYQDLSSEVDGAIEKAVGLTNNETLSCPRTITSVALGVISKYPTPSSTSTLAIASSALQMEKDYICLVEAIFSELETAQLLSLGLNDFLMGSVNSHDTHVYKLQQRVKSEIEN
jgi:hypothetical protein